MNKARSTADEVVRLKKALADAGSHKSATQRDHKLNEAHRSVIRAYRQEVTGTNKSRRAGEAFRALRDLAREAFIFLGGEADLRSWSLKDYEYDKYGPYLGVSDEGSAANVIRDAALASPKAKVLGANSPAIVGLALDGERLGAIGEVAVGPQEYANIWLETAERILTSTNIGTRLNVRWYKAAPLIRVEIGPVAKAISNAKKALNEIVRPFLKTPNLKPRPLVVSVQFVDSDRSHAQCTEILKALVRHMESAYTEFSPEHRLALLAAIEGGAAGRDQARRAIKLARAAGISEVVLDGKSRGASRDLGSYPGLLDYLDLEFLRPVLHDAFTARIELRRRNGVDTETVARNVWSSLSTARRMGLELGKYGTCPLTLEESSEVIRQVQEWFADWSAAPVYYVEQSLVTKDAAYDGKSRLHGLRKWLRMVAQHKVPVVLIDTAEKSTARNILRDKDNRGGYLSVDEILRVDKLARGLGIRVLWAGGIRLEQCFTFGRMGVFGVYVTSAAATTIPVPKEYERDPVLPFLKEPTFEGVSRAKLLIEAGFLSARLADPGVRRSLEQAAKAFMASLPNKKGLEAKEALLIAATVAAWKQFTASRQH